MSHAIIPVMQARYDVGDVVAETVLTGGEWNRVIRLESTSGVYVVRISHPSTSPATLDYSHVALRLMSERFEEVAAPIPAGDGSTYFACEGRFAALFPYLAGSRAPSKEPHIRQAAAQMLARLHSAALELPRRPHPEFVPLCLRDWERNALWVWPG